MFIKFLAFQSSVCFQYAVNSESEDSEQEIENENSMCQKVHNFYFYYMHVISQSKY